MKKYDLKKLESATNNYKKQLKNIKGKTFLIISDIENVEAYYSLAPLSKAIHELDGDMNVQIVNKNTESIKILENIWKSYDDLKKGIKNKKTLALDEFISILNKKTQNKTNKIFSPPEFRLVAEKKEFVGSFNLQYDTSWLTEYRKKDFFEVRK